jgi:hypothetical protein
VDRRIERLSIESVDEENKSRDDFHEPNEDHVCGREGAAECM